MIGKVVLTGKGFGETCEYLEREESLSEVLAVEGVRAHDPRLMAEDFEWQHRLMPEKEKPVFHGVLSFPPEERPDDNLLVQLSKAYLERIGMVNTQYAFVKHMDKEHLHVHVLANRVNNDGKPIGKGLIIERSIKAARELTEEYGLRMHHGKRLDRTHLDALHEPDAKRYQIYSAVREVLPGCRDLSELEARLAERGVTVRYRHDPETKERQGISFHLENRSFKGSRVDAGFSFKRLEQTLQLQERQVQEKAQLRSLSEALERMVKGRPAGWDQQESLSRRQDLKERLEKSAEERQAVEQARQLRVKQEKELADELVQRHSQRQGLGL
ncbi:MAG TPA: relaxase/mobilization nuclease domain-containing protein [Puia sp.]|nr:relaxase/mobilization nuclease domain-containing protein [Puia sp.]